MKPLLAIVAAALLLLLSSPPESISGARDLTYFQSPSENISCAIYAGVRCDIKKKNWAPPPKPKSCRLDWGYGLEVGRKGRGRFICAGDSVFGGPKRVLKYGRSISRGRYTCRMKVVGMRCVNRRNGHGFFLSRQRARPF